MHFDQLKRREFITLVGGAAAAWPVRARAQQPERVRRIGVLTNLAADDPEGQVRNTAFAQALAQLGWTVGQNLRIEIAGLRPMLNAFAGTPPNWSRSPPMSC
jgi:putative ABC transport system substrate-binding protein